MKLRGTLGGLNLLLEPGDTAQSVAEGLRVREELLGASVTLEIHGDADPGALEAALLAIRGAGGTPGRVRAPRVTVNAPAAATEPVESPLDSARTVIVPGSIRAGNRREYRGSVIVLGDVNPGAEVIAGGDVIVVGALRGVAHAGQGGYADAIVWARPIASAQIRIGDAVARAPEGSSLSNMQRREGPPVAELARLQGGQIVIDIQK
ncbi:septum site-determining protein MinC [Deinococcus metalli]|uniref:Septum site-determining protein MinC n=1 Tax=Deinococcus metalli TaxID=1141878 RepID=A0A7W8NQY1_9DEIO|nr:septum site-determining protein MinC [Deinococcus metalli]MBB5375562.1 septum site-determining protein MinC [Deinococcus metalli]GHF28346.1 putative septum site-determining protein MinC [Deinococcus metalli]